MGHVEDFLDDVKKGEASTMACRQDSQQFFGNIF